jgi:hypothetical protein
MPKEPDKRPKYVLVALGKLSPSRYAIVNWTEGEVIVLGNDREGMLDHVRELNGNPLKPVRKKGRPRQEDMHSVRAELRA